MWIIKAWQHISPDVIVKGFKNCCVTSAVDGAEDYMLWNESEEMGMLGLSVRKLKALTVKMGVVTLIGKGR